MPSKNLPPPWAAWRYASRRRVGPRLPPQLPAGQSNIQGEQALAFLRTRHAFGDGSDIARIKAQQSFLASMTRKIKDDGTLTDPPKCYTSRTPSPRTSPSIGAGQCPFNDGRGIRLKNIDLAKVAFVTVPTGLRRPDPNRVQLAEPAGWPIFCRPAERR